MRLSRRTLVMTCAGAALVAVLLGIMGWTLLDARAAARRQAEQGEGNIALALERDIARTIGTVDLSLLAAVKGMATPGLATIDPAIRQAILFDAATDAADLGGVFVTDAAGHILYDSMQQNPARIDIADRAFFAAHRDHPDLGLLITPPLLSRRDGRPSIGLTRRVSNADGSFAGVAVAVLKLSYFQSLFSGIDLGGNGVINLISTDGTLIARRPPADREIGRDMRASAPFQRFAAGGSGDIEATATIDTITRLYHYQKIADYPLILGVGFATRDIYAEWARKSAIVGAGLILLCALGGVLAMQLRRELRRRVQAEIAARDAAASAQLNRDLSAALAPLDALFNNSADTMLVVRIRADGAFVYEAVNLVWQKLVGVSAGSAVGRTPQECLTPDFAATILAGWRECAGERRPVRMDFEMPAGSGRAWEAMVIPIFGEAGEVTRLIVVGRETTERSRMESELRQAQKMEVIGRLAAGVGHDFNNILQVIAGGHEILRDEASLSGEARTILDMADKATRRGSYLTQHLLSYSRKQLLNPKLLDPGEVVADLNLVLSRTLGTDIAVTTSVAPSAGLVRADRSQLETALMNLAINASQAMPGGGSLRIDVSSAEALADWPLPPGRYVVIGVTDTGTGMGPEVLACIFDPFFTTKGLEGTGLGLAMVQGFSRQSGGDVRVDSRLGEGTRFEIWLPEVAEVRPPRQPAEPVAEAAGTAHVLLVDDADDVLITLAAFLRTGGFTSQQASGAKQALEVLGGGARFDLLVTDYMMPSMKGPDLIRQARLIQPDLPALVISGYADVSDVTVALANTTFLHKPFQRSELIAQVRAAVAGARRAASETSSAS